MRINFRRTITIGAIGLLVAGVFAFGAGQQIAPQAAPPSRLATAKGLRCTFPLNATGTWKKDGQPDAGLKASSLVLIFDSINTDDGTAKLRNGTMESEVVVRAVTGYLHLMQSFRSGPLYTTTVFDKESSGGKFKAVHSRHEYFTTPLEGATSSPEQYYGECEIKNQAG
jgi:hypothetical protein